IIAFGKGGACETVVDGKTGVLYEQQTIASLTQAIQRFETLEATFDPMAVSANAEQFSIENFKANLSAFVESKTSHITSYKMVDLEWPAKLKSNTTFS